MLKFMRVPRSNNISTCNICDVNVSQRTQQEETKDEVVSGNLRVNKAYYPSHTEYETLMKLIEENELLFEQRKLNRQTRQQYIDELYRQRLISEQILKNHAVHLYKPEQNQHKPIRY